MDKHHTLLLKLINYFQDFSDYDISDIRQPGFGFIVKNTEKTDAFKWASNHDSSSDLTIGKKIYTQNEFISSKYVPVFCIENTGDRHYWGQYLEDTLMVPAALIDTLCHIYSHYYNSVNGADDVEGPVTITLDAMIYYGNLVGKKYLKKTEDSRLLDAFELFIKERERRRRITSYPWSDRTIFKHYSTESSVTGAVINIVDNRAAFIDVMGAFITEFDFLQVPINKEKIMFCNNSPMMYSRTISKYAYGYYKEARIEVQNKIYISKANEEICDEIYDMLIEYGLEVGDLEYVKESKITFESVLDISLESIYIMVMNDPMNYMHNFVFNESSRLFIGSTNDILLYTDGDYSTKVTLARPLPPANIVCLNTNKKKKAWYIKIEHYNEEQLNLFIERFKYMLYDMNDLFSTPSDKSFKSLGDQLMSLMKYNTSHKEVPTILPEIGLYTKMYTKKSETTKSRSASNFNRPIYITRSTEATGEYGRIKCTDVARMHVTYFHDIEPNKALSRIYISSNGEMVSLHDAMNKNLEADSFSAYYISAAKEAYVITNAASDGDSIIPRIQRPSINTVSKSKTDTVLLSEVIKDDKNTYFLVANYQSGTAYRTSLEQAVASALKVSLDNSLLDPIAAKQELFDHTLDEIMESYAKEQDSLLHIRMLEEKYGVNIIVYAETNMQTKIITHQVLDVDLETPRHANVHYREFKHDKTIVLFKYRDETWKYSEVHLINEVDFKGLEELTQSKYVDFNTNIRDIFYKDNYSKRVQYLDPHSGDDIEIRPLEMPEDLDIIEQHIDKNGHCTGIVINLAELEGLEGSDGLILTKGLVSVFFYNTGMPYPRIPIASKTHPIVSDQGEKYELPHMNAFIPIKPKTSIAVNVTEEQLNEFQEYQRPTIVFTSIMAWTCLQQVNKVKHLPKDYVTSVISRLPVYEGQYPSNSVTTWNRLSPTDYNIDADSIEEAVRHVTRYFAEGIPRFTDAATNKLQEYLEMEFNIMRKRKVSTSAQIYIDGVQDFNATNLVYPSELTRRTFTPTYEGKRSIVYDFQEYEYAVIRRHSRDNNVSCYPMARVDNNVTATELNNKTSFMMVKSPNVTIYGFSIITNSNDGTTINNLIASYRAKQGDDLDVSNSIIKGTKDLSSRTFTKSQYAIFSTSRSECQGSWFRLYIYVN